MSSAALYFASGESLYLGAALMVAAGFASQRWPLVRNSMAWVGLIFVVAACPPLSWLTYGFLGLLFLLWLFLPKRPQGALIAVNVILVGFVVLIAATEFSHRKLPVIVGPSDDQLVIIGDSLSSGLGESQPWPEIFQEETGVQVKNLAHAGAGVADALAMATQVQSDDHLLLLEIGGNDLLAGFPSREFEAGLEALLTKISAPDRTVVMFELPLIPSRIGYGQAQRRLAAKYHVFLIPKHFLADVLRSGTTSDGLHLSQAGGRRMAAFVASALSPVLKSEPSAGRSRR